MDDKELKKLFEKQNKELTVAYNRQSKLILEEFDRRLSIVAEGHTDIVRTLDNHTKILSDHSRKLNAIIEMVAMNTEQIEFIKSMLKRKVDLDEYEKLEKRVSLLEKKLRLY